MRKQTKRKPVGMHPFLKQTLRARWNSTAVEGEIHSLIGADRDRLAAYASILFFVAGACALHRRESDSPEFRILRGSINVLDEMMKRASMSITDADRAALHSGMMAAHRLISLTPPDVVDSAAHAYAEQARAWPAGVPR